MLRRSALALFCGLVLSSCDTATNPNVPAYLAFADSIGTLTAGAVMPAFRVEVRSTSHQVVTSDTASITIIMSGVLNGTTTKAAVNGVATFTDISVPQAGTYFLRASATGFASYNSNQFTVTP